MAAENYIASKLSSYLGYPVFEQQKRINDFNQGQPDRPDEVHVIYTVTSRFITEGGPELRNTKDKYVQTEQYLKSISYTAVAASQTTAADIAEKIRDYLTFYGYDDMDGTGIVVVNMGAISDRNFTDEESMECRSGFDVTIRCSKVLEKYVEYFDSVEINEKIIRR